MRRSPQTFTLLLLTSLTACVEPTPDTADPLTPADDATVVDRDSLPTAAVASATPAASSDAADAPIDDHGHVDADVAEQPADTRILAAGTLYDLPLLANDLGDLERYYTRDHAQNFSQKFGYDISARRRKDDGTWTSLLEGVTDYSTDPHNSDTLAWGRNFYAMADGVVVGCWRNAPSNPRPKLASEDSDVIPFEDREWLHQEYRNGRISGGGNHLYVLHDDGTYALYAHAIPGSIPASICPNNATLYPEPVDDSRNEHCVLNVQAVANGARIHKGQLLGRIGNSGNSTGPHLHVHVAKRDVDKTCSSSTVLEGVQLSFARGLSTPWNNGAANIDAWTSFSGSPIPNGEVLFWPPTRLASEYARHAFPRADYARLFTHLANSGFKPVLFDGYTVGDDTRFNFVWRPADRSWRARRDMSLATFDTEIQNQTADGYEPVWAESYTTASGVRYAAIFEFGAPGTALLKTNLSVAEHDAWLQTAKSQGLDPRSISVVSSGGQLRYTDLYRSNNIGAWTMRSQIAAADYQDVYTSEKAAGRWPVYANAYIHDGTTRFSVVFASSGGPASAGHGLTASGYQDLWESNLAQGRLTRVVTGYDGAQSLHRFLGVWK